MQEKIHELRKILDSQTGMNGSPWTFFLGGKEKAITEIAKLFERKVIWEGAEDIHHETVDLGNGIETELTYIGCLKFGLNIAGHKGKHGQRVRVIVEDIDESRT